MTRAARRAATLREGKSGLDAEAERGKTLRMASNALQKKTARVPARPQPVTVVVTGGVACGKSRLLAILREIWEDGARFFSSDDSVRALLESPRVIAAIKRGFGGGVLTPEGVVDRARLGDLVFKDRAARAQLEALLHPGVLKDLAAAREGAAREGANLFVAEVPLYYEIGEAVRADHVIVVASSPEVQLRRLMQGRRLSQDRGEAIMASQLPVMEKASRASLVVWNDDGEDALEDQAALIASIFNIP
jgi:dephospho-CoA kinase